MRQTSMRIVTAMAVILFLGGCTDEGNRPAVCDSYDSVQASADDLRNANLSENGLSQVRTDLQALRQNLDAFLDDARAQYTTQVDSIEKAVEQLATTVDQAKADPGPMTFSAVGDAAAWLRDQVHRLGQVMGDTC